MPQHYLSKLNGNLSLLYIPMKSVKTATVLFAVKTGSKYETKEINGLSHFLEHMFFKGTKKLPTALALASELDALGGVYNAFTTKEYTGYFVKAESKQLLKAVAILGDMLTDPLFEQKEIDKEKGVIIEEINMYEDNPAASIEDIFEGLLYGDSPAGWDVIGTKKNVNSFTRDDFLRYYQQQYTAGNSFICLVGNLPIKTITPALEKIAKLYNQGSARKKLAVKEKQIKPAWKIKEKKTDQLHLSLGVRSGVISNSLVPAWRLLAVILGGSMSSRLFVNLRERHSLAYYVATHQEFYTDSGYLTTTAGINSDQWELAIKIILEEYKKLTKELVSKDELRRVKDLCRGRLFMGLESSDELASFYARQLVLSGRPKDPEALGREMEKVSSADIRRAAQKIFVNHNLNLAIIGSGVDGKKIKKLLRI